MSLMVKSESPVYSPPPEAWRLAAEENLFYRNEIISLFNNQSAVTVAHYHTEPDLQSAVTVAHYCTEPDLHYAVTVAHYYTEPDLHSQAEEAGGCVTDSLEIAGFGSRHAAGPLLLASKSLSVLPTADAGATCTVRGWP